jgi:CRP-like cAMP-binding protein
MGSYIISPEKYSQTLDGTTLFDRLDEVQALQVLEKARLESRQKNGYFFHENEPANKVYMLAQGKIKLIRTSADGKQVILGYYGPGKEMGVIAALDVMQYPVSAQAARLSDALVWDKQEFKHIMVLIPQVAINAMQILAARMGEFQTRIGELSNQKVEQRLAHTLLRLAKQDGISTDRGILIDLPLTRQDLGEMTGATIFTISRTLKEWEKKGFIYSQRERIIVRSPLDLAAISESAAN